MMVNFGETAKLKIIDDCIRSAVLLGTDKTAILISASSIGIEFLKNKIIKNKPKRENYYFLKGEDSKTLHRVLARGVVKYAMTLSSACLELEKIAISYSLRELGT